MSEEMAKRKAEEIAALEEQEKKLLEETKEDLCPNCGLPTTQLIYINPNFLRMFGWVECTRCGVVYAPVSIRKQKVALGKANMAPEIKINE